MHDPLRGRPLMDERNLIRVVNDATGEEQYEESVTRLYETPDGATFRIRHATVHLLDCQHPIADGGYRATCDGCNEELGRTAYICERCACNCAICGAPCCLRHSRPTPDGTRLCLACSGASSGNFLGKLIHTLGTWF